MERAPRASSVPPLWSQELEGSLVATTRKSFLHDAHSTDKAKKEIG